MYIYIYILKKINKYIYIYVYTYIHLSLSLFPDCTSFCKSGELFSDMFAIGKPLKKKHPPGPFVQGACREQ